MEQMVDYFKDNKYIFLEDVLDAETCAGLTQMVFKAYENEETHYYDDQSPISEAFYGLPILDSLLGELKPIFEEASGIELIPTYSYARIYRPGDKLHIHKDRDSCEISATITLGFDGESIWPIHFSSNPDASDRINAIIPVGSAILYKGKDLWHWRSQYEQGNWQVQVFLHYVDANGKYKDFKFDKREKLGEKPVHDTEDQYWHFGQKQNEKFLYVSFENVLTQPLIDNIVEYADSKIKPATLFHGHVDQEIRTAYDTELPIEEFEWFYKNIEDKIMKANFYNYKFSIEKMDLFAYIEYHGSNKGHYDWHVDGQIHMGRKLSFSLMLSDPSEYEGGELILNDGREHVIKPKKGQMIVFPSNVLHKVTPVTKGIRRVIVSWIYGSHFV